MYMYRRLHVSVYCSVFIVLKKLNNKLGPHSQYMLQRLDVSEALLTTHDESYFGEYDQFKQPDRSEIHVPG